MYWWIKDAFVDRTINNEVEQHHGRNFNRNSVVKRSLSNLKSRYNKHIAARRQKQEIKRSLQILSTFSDHYLADIGLRRHDLNSIAQGNYPGLYQESATTKSEPQRAKLTLCSNVSKKIDDKDVIDHNDFYKAA